LDKDLIYKVIVAEDEELILNSIIKKIQKSGLGFKVIATAQDGNTALNLIENNQPDLLITDIRMPVMDGLELIKNVYEKYPYIKKIIISGYGEFSYAQQALKYEVKEYLLKPVKQEALTEALGKVSICIESELADLKHDKLPIKDNYDYTPEQIAHMVEYYIKENYVNEINFDLIAQKFNFNASYLSKIFTKYIGDNPSKYVINLRINRARNMLINSKEMTIKEVGELVGYEDQFYFSRIFKNVTGMSPGCYRNMHDESKQIEL
jgi:YesN/AraC family two-component response regulator